MRVAVVCLLSSMAFGQYTTKSVEVHGDTMTLELSDLITEIRRPRVGDPFAGQHFSEHVQVLADGTRINQRHDDPKIWRDSQGRTRTEREIRVESGERPFILIEISDPVGGSFYVLGNGNKVAHRIVLTPSWVKEAPPPVTPKPMNAPCQMQNARQAPPPCSSERLGPQNVEGVIAEGWRTTDKIVPGSSSEWWWSDEVKLVVLSKVSNPKDGATTTGWINMSHAEPDPSLFAPPVGYTVVDEKDSFSLTLKRQ
jgi:hypothetical protein